MLIRDESITDLLTRILRSRGLCTYSAACCKVATCSSFSFPVKCHQHMRIKLAEFILARALRNGTKNTGGPLCVFTPHMQSKGSASASLQSVANFSYGYTLERITLSAFNKSNGLQIYRLQLCKRLSVSQLNQEKGSD